MREQLMSFEDHIEEFAVSYAEEFYREGTVPTDSSMWCGVAAKHFGRDEEEALLLYATLFPYAYKYIGEIENIKRNAI
jgi:hypothetical protein